MTKPVASIILIGCILISCCITLFRFSVATDTIIASRGVLVGETVISAGQAFELGFFSPGNSGNRYVGIWFKNMEPKTVVWVANRESPLAISDTAASLSIGGDGNLRVMDGKLRTVWSTNVLSKTNNSIAVLSDHGDLILKDNSSGGTLWESFQHPCDVLIVDMAIGITSKTGENRVLSSWRSDDDPSPGNFTLGILRETPVQVFVWKDQEIHWRSGLWNGVGFVGMERCASANSYINKFVIQQNSEAGTLYLMYNEFDNSFTMILKLASSGSMMALVWDGDKKWNETWEVPLQPCDFYGACGPFGICNNKGSPICTCMKGHVPKSNEEWKAGNWSSGCMRRTELSCQKNMTENSTSSQSDGFLLLSQMKLPDKYLFLSTEDSQGCQTWCLDNCSCTAYAYPSGIGCLVWAGELIDTQQFTSSSLGGQLFLKLARSELGRRKRNVALIISLTVVIILSIVIAFVYAVCKKAAKLAAKTSGEIMWKNQFKGTDLYEVPTFKFSEIALATNNFGVTNKLGEGGFGAVYKGLLKDGREIAVKRLSRCSGQGVEEFKNEIILISKLQHRNLVRTLGFCIEGEEKLILYEYMQNGSLDTFLFDPNRKETLTWGMRFYIIEGVARGILYLHRDSRLRIIHRDMKAGNILLDKDMIPKISDFGLARTFLATQDSANTHLVVGTFGYMSPEYAMRGVFSEKSDVFSFGILLLEVISSKKNSSFFHDDIYLNLAGYAWQLWNGGRGLDLIDRASTEHPFPETKVLRCLTVGLLCVQDYAEDRPSMSEVVLMLSSDSSLPLPKQPSFFPQSLSESDQRRSTPSNRNSANGYSMTAIEGVVENLESRSYGNFTQAPQKHRIQKQVLSRLCFACPNHLKRDLKLSYEDDQKPKRGCQKLLRPSAYSL
ncbi:G-type lectin S-receptor-like serine/threonine-protein kinase SD1-29-like protein [Drosera capensis]